MKNKRTPNLLDDLFKGNEEFLKDKKTLIKREGKITKVRFIKD